MLFMLCTCITVVQHENLYCVCCHLQSCYFLFSCVLPLWAVLSLSHTHTHTHTQSGDNKVSRAAKTHDITNKGSSLFKVYSKTNQSKVFVFLTLTNLNLAKYGRKYVYSCTV